MKYATAVPVGRGGMGEVTKAWDPRLERYVALKFLLRTEPELEARMLREARAQARVEHPNVCRVYEVGRLDGRAYIAMQFIEGETLDRAARALPLEQRVRLVQRVAEAVHAAHAVGLIHRDLKPGNVLVEEGEDGSLTPYVLDFGIAREHAVPGHTVTGQVVGTPGYLSPEQARGDLAGLDRRSDVYSLGVILYELVSGELPHPGDSAAEQLVHLLEREPRPLCEVAPQVPRDLETVVQRCLEADPGRRYASARELAEDLGRFLRGEPVHARPTGRLERLWRRAKRHKVAAGLLAAASLLVLLLLAALVAGGIKYTLDLRQERNVALDAREAAEAKEREAAEVTRFLVELFELPDPHKAQGRTIPAREVLDHGASELDAGLLSDQPRTRAALLHTIGVVYSNLGLYDESDRLLREALALRRKVLGDDHPDAIETLGQLASEKLAARSFEEAEALYRQALDLELSRPERDEIRIARTRVGLANSLQGVGKLDEARDLNEQALAVLVPALGKDDRSVLVALSIEAILLRAQGEMSAAEALYVDLLERQRRTLGPDHPQVAATLNNLAYLLKARGDLAGAEQRYREAWEVNRRVNGEGHPNTLMVMQNLASVLEARGKYDEVETVIRRIVELQRREQPPGHWRVGSALVSGLGGLLMRRGRYAEAEPVLREGVAIYEAALGEDHSWTANARGVLAACLFGLGRDREARELARASREVLAAQERLTSDNRFGIERSANFLDAVGEPAEAAAFRALLTEDDEAGAGVEAGS